MNGVTMATGNKSFFRFLVLSCAVTLAPMVVSLLLAGASASAPAKETGASKSNSGNAGLHRADFRVEGASCVVCLRRVAKKLKSAAGVVKADVSIFRPYWALVVYDSKKTALPKIFEAAGDEKVKFADVEDVAISEMPLVLLPKQVSIPDRTDKANGKQE